MQRRLTPRFPLIRSARSPQLRFVASDSLRRSDLFESAGLRIDPDARPGGRRPSGIILERLQHTAGSSDAIAHPRDQRAQPI
jgi:hypothetical protein